MNNQNNLEVKAEKLIQKPVRDVYRALSEGRLFMNCGCDSASMELDFKVGGKYRIDFKNHNVSNTGEFLEIVPDKKIVFSWCSSFGLPLTPDTKVTIELFPDGDNTKLKLLHSGFKTDSSREQHQKGWDGGLADLATEIQEGKLRIVRTYTASVEKLYETCKASMVKGEVLESVPNKKIVFNLDSTRVTLSFNERDNGISSVELIHANLNSDALLKSHRLGWQKITEAISSSLSR